ncbi:DUF1684 domain-containing protein [Kocuria arenosa]|uniref:DUF1684 domain-containing protein n=1 Tax=Kocuria arenosa TaxID=3071446 RepID=UPI0034D3FA8A
MSTRTEILAFEEQWRNWRAAHQESVGDPHGFLAVTDLHWLEDQPRTYAHVPGTWSVSDDQVAVVLAPEERLSLHGVELNLGTGTRHVFAPIAERDGVLLDHGCAVVELAKRGGQHLLRPRHPHAPLVSNYRGTPAFLPSEQFVLPGRFVPFEEPHPTTVGAAVEGLQHVYDAPGQLRFTTGAREHVLTAFNGADPRTLVVLFTDETSGRSTYVANRSLTVKVEPDGSAVLDFNRAVNLPCAYTDLATCPLPPVGNHLPFAVEAGEKTPFERSEHP